MDKIIINDLLMNGIIGIHPHERETPQKILVNVIAYIDMRRAAQSDDITDCVDYDMLAEKIKTHVESAKRFTVEALANDLASICLQENEVKKVIVRVEKPNAISSARSVGVEIERVRE
jgi:FolB domain-containing protein